jgi:hypothetical protein
MTLHYAITQGADVIGVQQASNPEGLPPGAVPLPAWAGWPLRPSPSHRLHVVAGALKWVDPRTLPEARAARIQALRDAREAAITAGFTWDSSPFDAAQLSQTRLLGLYISSQSPTFAPQPWRLADNTWRTLTAACVAGVCAALQAHVTAQFAQFAAREAAVNAASSIAEIDAVAWEA